MPGQSSTVTFRSPDALAPLRGFCVKRKALAIVFLCGAGASVGVLRLANAADGQAVAARPAKPPRPDFDVASITLARRGDMSPSNPMYLRPGSSPGSMEARNAFVAFLISNAYDVKMAHIYNGPRWLRSDGYDISARTDLSSSEVEAIGTSLEGRTADMNRRLQSLLEQRFHLRVHRETRQLQVFVLTVAPGGLKVQPQDCVMRGAYRPPEPGQPSPRFCGTYSLLRFGVGWKLTGLGITMQDLARALSFQEMPTLVDKTGYADRFNATLQWTPDAVTGSPVPLPDDAAPSLSTALHEQLGIRLDSARGPVDVLVIDHVERPTEN
jgi:uncharacterized protein (TIGR03435 family)